VSDQIVQWIFGNPPVEDEGDDDDVVDVSQLGNGDDEVDSGVTSGADPSSWDPINIERKP